MIAFFARHPTAANLLMFAFIVSGLFAAPVLQRETFPRVQPSKVEITVLNPGARAEEVEEAICQRIEDAIDGIDNVAEITCEAREGLARAVVEMTEGTDLDRFTTDLRTEIDAITDFPDQAEDPVVKQLGRTDFVASVALTGAASKPDLNPCLTRGVQFIQIRDYISAGQIDETIIGGRTFNVAVHALNIAQRASIEPQGLGFLIADIRPRFTIGCPTGVLEFFNKKSF